jgi:hypothetical protein
VADALMPVRDRFGEIGGSRAQREVFDDALLYGLLRDNRSESARVILEQRLSRRPSARESQLLAALT